MSYTNITYDIYLKLYDLCHNVSNKDLLEQLLKQIVLNLEIWNKCDFDNNFKVISHWKNVVSQDPSSIKYMNFGYFMSITRIYYHYSDDTNIDSIGPSEQTKLTGDERKNCREIIFDIIVCIAKFHFSALELNIIVSNILTVGNVNYIMDLLQLLLELIDTIPDSFKEIGEEVNNITIIQYLFNLRNTDIISLIIAIITRVHRYNLLHFLDISMHMDIILHQISSVFINNQLFIDFIEYHILNSSPELFSVITWMGYNIGVDAIEYFLDSVEPQQDFTRFSNWSQWLVLCIYKFIEDNREVVINIIGFLLACCDGDVQYLFNTIEVVGRALEADVYSMKKLFIEIIGNILLSGINLTLLDAYFNLIRYYLFFVESSVVHNTLKNKYSSSLYNTDLHQESAKMSTFQKESEKKASKKRKSRHSLNPSVISDYSESTRDYTPKIAERAIASLIPSLPSFFYNISFKGRRVSLNSGELYKQNYGTQNDEICDPLMPSKFDNMIAELAKIEFSYTFGLRLDDNQKWLDMDIAEQAIRVYMKYRNGDFRFIVYTIAAFLIRYKSSVINDLLDDFEVSTDEIVNGAYSLFAYRNSLNGNIYDFSYRASDVQLQAFKYLELLSQSPNKKFCYGPQRLIKHIMELQTRNSRAAFKIFEFINDDLVSLASNNLTDNVDMITKNKLDNKKLWNRYWHLLTQSNAPWKKSLADTSNDIFYKRDRTYCSVGCPIKLKRNYRYTNHKDASIIRDKCDPSKMYEEIEAYKTELAKKHEEKCQNELFELSDEKIQLESNGEEPKSKVCILELPCEICREKSCKESIFTLLTDFIVITYSKSKVKIFNMDNVKGIMLRTRLHRPTAIEIFFKDGKNIFVNFPNINSLTVLKSFKRTKLNGLDQVQTIGFKSYFEEKKLTEKWVNRKISTFEYLLALNTYSGRSYNDTSQYPFLPWVIKDYTTSVLNLNDPKIYRDLTKPIGALNNKRLKCLQERASHHRCAGMGPYLYSSTYICSLLLYLWLIRVEPFTSLHIQLQSGKFDHPERIFYSIQNSWESCNNNLNDYRELIPEFFCFPEMFLNKNGFDLGSIDDTVISDVILPPWAKDPFEFVYINRKALESEHVSNHINHWIDLVWGYKQDKSEAIKANNIFIPQVYPNIWNKVEPNKPTVKAEIEAMLTHVGQIPQKLFDKPHPTRSQYNPLPIVNTLVFFNIAESLIFGMICITEKNYKLYTLDDRGAYIRRRIKIKSLKKYVKSKPRSSTQEISKKDQKNVLYIDKTDSKHSAADLSSSEALNFTRYNNVQVLDDDSLLLTGGNDSEIYKVTPGQHLVTVPIPQRNAVNNMIKDGNWLLLTDIDSDIYVYLTNNLSKPVISIPTFSKRITCCAMSSEFNQIVCGTEESILIFVSLTKKIITRTVQIERRKPLKILMTKSWGFVIVIRRNMLEMTQNITLCYITLMVKL